MERPGKKSLKKFGKKGVLFQDGPGDVPMNVSEARRSAEAGQSPCFGYMGKNGFHWFVLDFMGSFKINIFL